MATKQPKALIVEDDIELRALCVRGLEAWGYSAIQCSDGQRGWETLNDNADVTLLILDVCLPGLDGRDVIEKIRASQTFSNLAVVMVSGFITTEEFEECITGAATRFLRKPFSYSKLKECIEALTPLAIKQQAAQ